MNKLFSFISSLKTAIVLFVLIIALGILASLVPQQRGEGFYREEYPPAVSSLILSLHFHRFYRSALFLIPAGLFFVNLLSCTFRRIVGRARSGAERRIGPDVIHISVLLLMIFGALSLFYTTENRVLLGRRERFTLPGSYSVRIDEMEELRYEDGGPKDWLTQVTVFKGDRQVREYVIEVNKPLRIGMFKVYQHSFTSDTEVILLDSAGDRRVLKPGERLRIEGRNLFIGGARETPGGGSAVRFILEHEDSTETFQLNEGETRLGLTVEEVLSHPHTGLLISYNPLFPFILGLLGIFIFGLGLTFIRKMGDKKR